MTDDTPRSDPMLTALRDGDSLAVARFIREYGPLLERIAEKHMAAGLKRRVGADDVAQSVCRTFVRRAGIGEFQIPDAESLWSLLVAITVTKVREQARFHRRQKRDSGREQHLDSVTPSGEAKVPTPVSAEPTPADVAEWSDQFEKLLGELDAEERKIVEYRLAGHTHEEIATKMDCSERTVRRLFKRLQERLLKWVGVED